MMDAENVLENEDGGFECKMQDAKNAKTMENSPCSIYSSSNPHSNHNAARTAAPPNSTLTPATRTPMAPAPPFAPRILMLAAAPLLLVLVLELVALVALPEPDEGLRDEVAILLPDEEAPEEVLEGLEAVAVDEPVVEAPDAVTVAPAAKRSAEE